MAQLFRSTPSTVSLSNKHSLHLEIVMLTTPMCADALTGLGHACGHNLIAMASLAGALATAEIMRTEQLAGTVVLFGTPAEEGNRTKL